MHRSSIFIQVLVLSIILSVFSSCKTVHNTDEAELAIQEDPVLEEAVIVNGTKLSIQPPTGFSEAHTFTGFQQIESGSSILIAQIPANFELMKKSLTPEKFKTQGVVIDSTREITLHGTSAILMFGKQQTIEYHISKILLLLGNDDEVYLLNGNYPLEMKEIGAALEASFLSCKYNATTEVVLEGPEDYEFDLEASNLQLAQKIGVAYYYSEDGLIPTETDHKTSIIATRSFGEVKTDDPKQYAIDRFYALPYILDSVQNTEPISIDNIEGYMTKGIGLSKKDLTKYSIVQVILFSDNMYYIFIASTKDAYEEKLTGVLETIRSFRRK